MSVMILLNFRMGIFSLNNVEKIFWLYLSTERRFFKIFDIYCSKTDPEFEKNLSTRNVVIKFQNNSITVFYQTFVFI